MTNTTPKLVRVKFLKAYYHIAYQQPLHPAGQEVELNEIFARIVVSLGYARFVEMAVPA